MKVLFTIQHPAHVHLFRNTIDELSANGHQVHTIARQKDINVDLLERYDIDHTVVAPEPKNGLHLPFIQLKYEWHVIRAARRIDPDVLVAMGEPSITHAAKLLNASSIVFTDTENATLQNLLAFPFADRICTPESYKDDIGEKQVRYPGYHELAYLHPNRFDPDPSVLEEADIGPDDRFAILRIVSWDAAHDVGDSGFDNIVDVVERLENTGVEVRITAEKDVPAAIEEKQVSIPPDRIHNLIAYADLYIGESATMATESAVLGTPAIFVSSTRRGYTDEIEADYGLMFNYSGEDRHERSLKKAQEILSNYDSTKWSERRHTLLNEKIDATKLILDQIGEASSR